MIMMNVDSENAMTIAISCASNVGPSLDLNVGPAISWGMLSAVTKWLLTGLMLMGRLEIFTVVVLFTPSFWKDN